MSNQDMRSKISWQALAESITDQASFKLATTKGQQQYQTPASLSLTLRLLEGILQSKIREQIVSSLKVGQVDLRKLGYSGADSEKVDYSVDRLHRVSFDPQCGADGSLIKGYNYNMVADMVDACSCVVGSNRGPIRSLLEGSTNGTGIDIDPRIDHQNLRTMASAPSFASALQMFEEESKKPIMVGSIRANPPFGLRWKYKGRSWDSSEFTWQWMKELANPVTTGIFITSTGTCEKFGWDKEPHVALRLDLDGSELWQNTDISITCLIVGFGYEFPTKGYVDFRTEKELSPALMSHQEIGKMVAERICKDDGPLPGAIKTMKPVSDEATRNYGKELPCPKRGGGYIYATFDCIAASKESILINNTSTWNNLQEFYRVLKARRGSEYAIDMDRRGLISINLSSIEEQAAREAAKVSGKSLVSLQNIDGMDPLAYITDRTARENLESLVSDGLYRVSPAFTQAVKSAINQAAMVSIPIMPITDFEYVAYTDEMDTLEVVEDFSTLFGWEWSKIKKGDKLRFITQEYDYHERFVRQKVHYSIETGESYAKDHDINLAVKDRRIVISASHNKDERTIFIQQTEETKEGSLPFPECYKKHNSLTSLTIPEDQIWKMFRKPKVETIEAKMPEVYQDNKARLELHSMINGFEYYPGQLDYTARVACKDHALVSAQTGCGKSLVAISLIAVKAADRVLVIAPKGTTDGERTYGDEDSDTGETDEDIASQWFDEIKKFHTDKDVYPLFNKDDLNKALRKGQNGMLPSGVYVTYPNAFFMNQSLEYLGGKSLNSEEDARKAIAKKLKCSVQKINKLMGEDESIRKGLMNDPIQTVREHGGIRCVVEPSIATLVGSQFDMAITDEAHFMMKLSAKVTQLIHINLQPRIRYALTATPIPNIASDIFSIMGWLCVPDWYMGSKRNAAWPFLVNQQGQFENNFLSMERDITQENINRQLDKRGRCTKVSPRISNSARLLKILKPTVASLKKQDCNPNLPPCEVVEVRVPMTRSQAKLYAYWMDKGNVMQIHENPLTAAMVQSSILRSVCTDPSSPAWNRGICTNGLTPKTAMMLGVIGQALSEGEQIIVISSRIGQNDLIQGWLTQSGIRTSRIDSTTPNHSAEAKRFKSKETSVLIMGIKCAQAYSFEQCCRMVCGSLEWSYGTLDQTKGRVWRVNSKKPVLITVILHENSIENLMYERLGTKQDAAAICLHGYRVPRGYVQKDPSEILAEHFQTFDENADVIEDEKMGAEKRKELMTMLKKAHADYVEKVVFSAEGGAA